MMSKPPPHADILVLGDHPCAYLAAALVRQNPSISVVQAVIPGLSWHDRLVVINPAFFELHEVLSPLRRKLELTATYGLKFHADDSATSSTHSTKSVGAYIGSFKQVHAAMVKLADSAGVIRMRPTDLRIRRIDEAGVDVALGAVSLKPKAVILSETLPQSLRRAIGLPDPSEQQVLHRYTFVRLKGAKRAPSDDKPVMPMSLDLHGTMNWGWLLAGKAQAQVAVVQPLASVPQLAPHTLLEHWLNVLVAHGVINDRHGVGEVISLDLPLAGALTQENVANRTLLIGPAGGFYSACAEDIYPNCWSAIFAAEVTRNSVNQPHVQDALQAYSRQWGASLGDYLRGPQQNLRFLLPLVYRNPIMAARLTEAILLGKSVVR